MKTAINSVAIIKQTLSLKIAYFTLFISIIMSAIFFAFSSFNISEYIDNGAISHINILKFVSLTAILILASIDDIKTKIVSNKYWYSILIIGLINVNFQSIIAGIVCFAPLFIVAFLLSLGGSDVKCAGSCAFAIGSLYSLFGLLIGLLINCILFMFLYLFKSFIETKKETTVPVFSKIFLKFYIEKLIFKVKTGKFALVPYLAVGFTIVSFYVFFI